MSLTITEAKDDILAMVKTAWDTTGKIMIYDDIGGVIPDTADAWARTTLRHTNANQATLSGGLGTQNYDRSGILTIQIFTPSGKGLASSDIYAKLMMDAFEGKQSANGVWFRNVRLNEIGPDGNFFQTNVVVDFEYRELK